jgi:D-beta-D-heptose 7-phosphate kinase/D-beta-D-heptose 1-phosphate adenosyltransferase
VGDLMLDQFVWGRVTRISPEAPVPVVRLERETSCLGGAGNVVRNLVALGGRAVPVGLRGDDRDGETLLRFFRDAGIATDGVIAAPGRPTTVKTRVIAHHQQVVRVDREEDGAPSAAAAGHLRDAAMRLLPGSGVLVISDYDKGVISEDLLGALLPEARRRGIPALVDPKVRLFRHYRPVTAVTPNARESMEAAATPARTDAEFEAIGRTLRRELACPSLLMTLGDRGMILVEEEGPAVRIPSTAREVYDVTGAGDTVIATLALTLAAGGSVREGAVLANLAAGVVVGKLGTAAVSPEELGAAVRAAASGAR